MLTSSPIHDIVSLSSDEPSGSLQLLEAVEFKLSPGDEMRCGEM